MHNSFYVFDNWGKNLNDRKMQFNYRKKMYTRRAKPIRITSIRINGVLLYPSVKFFNYGSNKTVRLQLYCCPTSFTHSLRHS